MDTQKLPGQPRPLARALLAFAAVAPLLAACGGGGDGTPLPVEPPAPEPPPVLMKVNDPFPLSDGDSGDKPKIQRAGDGTLVVVYGDAPDNSRIVYDVKANVERPARDVFARFCKPDATKTCDAVADWSAAVNISQSSGTSSISTAWRGAAAGQLAYPGDIDKANVKSSGPVMVATWVSKYCPDGDLATAGVQPTEQRAIRYDERDGRIIPFSCTWVARSTNNGVTWAAPVQLSTGIRDAIQDSNSGGFNTDTKKGQINISWQEDPQGLLIGGAAGPGDGASGASVNGGTDVWYAHASVDLSVPATPADDFVLAPAVRLTDNWTGAFAAVADAKPVFDAAGAAVPAGMLETGEVGAARPNIGLVGTTAIIAYEEKKNAADVNGKYVRYHSFTYNAPPATAAARAGCVISNPARNARRVRFLTQSGTDAGAGGIQLAIFWREGIANEGGSADIVLRRALGGFAPASMVPAVDAGCATSDPAAAAALVNAPAENLSSRSKTVTATDIGLADDTELNNTENAIAHRGVLRGRDLWIGYSYTSDLAKLALQQDNYNFYVRKFNLDAGGWELPRNVTNITDLRINVREPRLFGTPKSSATACPTGIPTDATTTDATQCQNTDIMYLAWGTQENVVGGQDLGLFITASKNAGATFFDPIRLSTAAGVLFADDESAYETQVVTRPDGMRFYGVWSQRTIATGRTVVEYASGEILP